MNASPDERKMNDRFEALERNETRSRTSTALLALALAVVFGLSFERAAYADGSGAIQQVILQMFGYPVAAASATNGQALTYDSSTKTWKPTTISTGSTYPVAPSGGSYTTTATGTRAVAAGNANSAANNDTGVFGYGLTTDADNQFLFGSSGFTSTPRFYFGNGASAASPFSTTYLKATSASTGNVAGSNLYLSGGDPSGTGSGGDASLIGASSSGGGRGGHVGGQAGAGTVNGRGGNANWVGGQGAGSGQGGDISAQAGQGGPTGAGGDGSWVSGPGGSTSGQSGSLTLLTNTTTNGDTGDILIKTSNATGTNRSGGSITARAGAKTGAGTDGNLIIEVQGGTEIARGDGTNVGFCHRKIVLTATQASTTTLTAAQSGALVVNTGTTASAAVSLPTTTLTGLHFYFLVTDADGVAITAPAGTTIRLGSAVTATGGTISSTTIGARLMLIADSSTSYVALNFSSGDWN